MQHSVGHSDVHAWQASTDTVSYSTGGGLHIPCCHAGWAQSDPHAGRSFQSFAADVAQVADKLGIKSFFVVGVR